VSYHFRTEKAELSKMKKFVFLAIMVLAASSFAFAHMPFGLDKVKEIKLLESNRDDVRKIFAAYKLETNEHRKYEDLFYTNDAEIEVVYSTGNCEDDEYEGLNIPKLKAVRISVSPKNPVKFTETEPIFSLIGTRRSKLKRERVYIDEENIYLYHNKDLGIGFYVVDGMVETIMFKPSKNFYYLMCDKKAAKRISVTSSWFSEPLKERVHIVCRLPNNPPDVDNVILSLTEITASCFLSDAAQNKSCSDGVKVLTVFAVSKDPEGDVITYDYKVSGGKIIGQGEKVLWDLSDIKPGTYTITAATDDGCGFCGKSMTKTVVVKECSGCNNK
jgi:hypothetical protein